MNASYNSFSHYPDNAIFNSLLNDKLVNNIAPAVVPLGLPPSSLEAFIGGLAGNSPPAAIAAIPGVTPEIIGVGITALKTAYMQSFKRVYVAAAVLSAVGAISMSTACSMPNMATNFDS